MEFFGFWATFTLIKLFNSHPRFSLYVKNTSRIDIKNRKTPRFSQGMDVGECSGGRWLKGNVKVMNSTYL